MAQTQEINIPVADPSDPYANPAAMPSEYALELNRLVELQMEGSVG